MKKILFLLSIIVLLFNACQTGPKTPVEVFEPDLKSPNFKVGEVEMQFDKTFPLPGIRKINVNVFYFPLEDAVSLQWRMDLINYYQFWSYNGRQAFIENLEKYKKDYEERNFGKGSRKTKRQYGPAEGYIIWQLTSFTVQAKAANIVDFGYFFVDKSPYFVVNQKEVKYEDPLSRDNNRQIPEMPMYFTRSQADELAAYFDPEFLASIKNTKDRILEVEIDEY